MPVYKKLDGTTRREFYLGEGDIDTTDDPAVGVRTTANGEFEYKEAGGDWIPLPSGGPLPKNPWWGTFAESFDGIVSSDGATITLSVEKKGGGDLTMHFSTGDYTLDCTPAQTITLTAGTATVPQRNYIYIPESTKVLTKDTGGWPSSAHIRIGFFFVPDATTVQTDGGGYVNQNWNDEYNSNDNMGHITHIGSWIRRKGATWFSGCDGAGTDGYITPISGGATVQVAAGKISQMHIHSYTAKDTSSGDNILVLNYPSVAYNPITNLNQALVDSTGASLSGDYYNIVLIGVANKSTQYSPLLMNLPSGGYANLDDAVDDASQYDVYDIPREFTKESSTAFYIARVTLKHSVAGGGTWTVEATRDLRDGVGFGGGGTGGGGLTDPMTTRGDMIYRNNSNVTDRLPVGTEPYSVVGTQDGVDVSYLTINDLMDRIIIDDVDGMVVSDDILGNVLVEDA